MRFGMLTSSGLRFLKFSTAILMIALALSAAVSSWNSMKSESGMRAMGEVVMNLVWKHLDSGPSAGKMHCTSTTIASQAPVRTTFSCCRKLPAIGMP